MDLESRLGLVTTVWLPSATDYRCILRSFVLYHLSIGFDVIHVHFDDPTCKSAELEFGEQKILNCDIPEGKDVKFFYREDDLNKLNSAPEESLMQNEVHIRQQHNCSQSAKICLDNGVRWLIHLDVDELFYWVHNPSNVKEFFSQLDLEQPNVDQITFINHEAIATKFNISNYFIECTKFRRNHLSVGISLDGRDCMEYWAKRRTHGQYMLAYDNGKSALKLSPETLRDGVPLSVHSWKFPMGSEHRSVKAFIDPRDMNSKSIALKLTPSTSSELPCVLHYPVCGFYWFYNKYVHLGNFPDSWFGGKLRIQPCFHTEARDVFQTGKMDLIQKFFKEQVVFCMENEENQVLWKKHLDSGTGFEVSFASELINSFMKEEEFNCEILDHTPLHSSCDTRRISTSTSTSTTTTTTTTTSSTTTSTSTSSNESESISSFNHQKAWLLSSIASEYLS